MVQVHVFQLVLGALLVAAFTSIGVWWLFGRSLDSIWDSLEFKHRELNGLHKSTSESEADLKSLLKHFGLEMVYYPERRCIEKIKAETPKPRIIR